jgi:hypothetical protein
MDLEEAKIKNSSQTVNTIRINIPKEGEVKLITAITLKEKMEMNKLIRVTDTEEEVNILIEEDILTKIITKEDKSLTVKTNKKAISIR